MTSPADNKPPAVRLKDIAADLGVSIVTVSKVLRDKPDVSQATRDRVLRRVKERNYQPNMLARGLASGRSYTAGLVLPDLTDPFFAELAKGLGATLRKSGYQLLLATSDDDPTVEQQEIENLLNRGVDVLLLASCRRDAGATAAFTGRVPCVLIDRLLPGAGVYFVGTDDVLAGRLATAHLADKGCRSIAHITGEGVSTFTDRLRGYREALKEHDLVYRNELVLKRNVHTGMVDAVGRTAMDELLALPLRPDAVFCYNDLLAVGAIRSVLAHGLRVPEDVAVIGCGNLALSTYLEVPLSSVDQGTGQLGEKAAQLALLLIEKPGDQPEKHVLIEPTVVKRASTPRHAT